MKTLVFLAIIWCASAFAYGGYYPFGDLHWKSPVASSGALPSSGNLTGDVRMELTAFNLYYWSGSGWVQITTGSGGSPGGANTDVQFNSTGTFGGSANLTWNGSILGVTGSVNASNFTDSALSTGLPVLSNAPFSTGTLSGSTTKFVTTTGAITSGDGVKWDASGNAVDTGGPAGTVSSVGLSMPASGFSVSGSPVTGSGTLSVSYSGTFPNAQIPAAQSASLGGVESLTCGSHEWMEQLANTGIFTCTQPGFSDLSGSASKTQLPNTIIYSDQANTYSAGPQSLGSQALSDQIANAGVTGTTLNKLAKINSSGSLVITATSDTSGAYGVVVAGAGTSGSADVAQVGQASCVFDGATTAGDYVTISSTTAGDCHDGGASAPAGVQAVGRVLTTNASAGTYAMALLSGGGGGGSTVPGGSSTDVQYNSSGSFAGDSGMTYDGSGDLTLTGKINATTANLSNLTASEPVLTDSSKNLVSGSLTGNTTKLATSTGTLTSGDCVKIDASGNLVDAGSACAASPTLYYQTVQSNTTSQTQRSKLNFSSNFSVSDDSGNGSTDVDIGVIPIAKGGTDNGSMGVTAGGVLYTDGTKVQNSGAGTSGYVLVSNGSSAPSWSAASGVNTANVSSSGTGSYHVESLSFAGSTSTSACTSGTCTIYANTGTWVASNGVSFNVTGVYNVSFAAGEFSSAPTCQCTSNLNASATNTFCGLGVPTTSGVSVFIIENSSTAENGGAFLTCMGPK